jgi:hypothetical protein
MSNALIQRLAVVFGPPDFSTDPAAYMSEIANLIRGFTAGELNKAADLLIREFRPSQRKPWPTPNEICTACVDARTMMAPPQSNKDPYQEWSEKAFRRADALIASDLGREAADSGWIAALHDFCREYGRLPNDAESYRCKVHAAEFNEAYRNVCGLNGEVRGPLKGLGDKMLAKRNRLAAIAHGRNNNT